MISWKMRAGTPSHDDDDEDGDVLFHHHQTAAAVVIAWSDVVRLLLLSHCENHLSSSSFTSSFSLTRKESLFSPGDPIIPTTTTTHARF